MTTYPCLVCDATQEGQRHFCAMCGGLTTYSQRELAPYEPLSLLVRWEAGSLYRGRVVLADSERDTSLDTDDPEATKTNAESGEHEQHTEVWIFTYDEEIVHTPALIRLQQEDRQLSQLPHPNLPKQLDRGHVGHRPYLIFEGRPMALPLPTWRPNLPSHVISTIFSRLAELVVLLQSAGIQRPVIDPFRLMVFWDEERDLLDFQWLPLPELGNYLYREGFTPKVSDALRAPTSPEEVVPASLLSLDEPNWTTQALHDPGPETSNRVMRGPLESEEEEESQRETTVVQRADSIVPNGSAEFQQLISAPTDITANLPTLKAISQKMAETDDFELMNALEELGESSEDLEALAKRLAELEEAGRLPAPPQVSSEASEDVEVSWTERDEQAPVEISISMDEQEAADLAKEMMARLHPPDDEETHPGVAPPILTAASDESITAASVPAASASSLEVVVAGEGLSFPPLDLAPAGASLLQASSFALPASIPVSSPPLFGPEGAPVDGVLTAQLVVQHHQNMRVQQNHPLDVSLMRLSPTTGGSPTQAPKVILTPVFPGCIVSPAEARLERWDQEVRFWVTPMVPGDLRDAASLQSRAEGAPVTAIALPCTCHKATLPRLFTLVAIAIASVALVPPPTMEVGWMDALWLFFHHWGFVFAGGLAIIAMLTRWWPRPLTPTVTRTAFHMDDSSKLRM